MTFANGFYLLLGFIITSACIMGYLRFAPRIQRVFSKTRHIDLVVIEKLATCAASVGLHNDIAGEKILVFTYKENSYAIRTDCSMAMEIAPNRWMRISASDANELINSMQPRKAPNKPENNQNNGNSNGKQHNNNNNGKQPDNNGNKPQNVIPNDQVEKWYLNRKEWEQKPTKFTVNKPYFFRKDADGIWFVDKQQNGNRP